MVSLKTSITQKAGKKMMMLMKNDELFYLKENTGEGRFLLGPAQQRFRKCQVLFGIK